MIYQLVPPEDIYPYFKEWAAETFGKGWRTIPPPAHTDDLLSMYAKAFAAGVALGKSGGI